MLDILNNTKSSGNINQTFILPISKINSQENLTHIPSISLCNIIFKIVIKTITNRLSPIIYRTRSTTVLERQITDFRAVCRCLIRLFASH